MNTSQIRNPEHLESEWDFPIPPMDDMQDIVRMRFLYDAVIKHADARLGDVLEIGCFKGCSTVFLAMAARKKGFLRVSTMDLFTGTPSWGVEIDTYAEASQRFESYGLGNYVRAIRGDSRHFEWDRPLAMLHIDGDHAYEAIASDLARFTPWLSPGGIVVIDDYDSGHQGVTRATHEFLAASTDFAIVEVNNARRYYGSICLRRLPKDWQSE